MHVLTQPQTSPSRRNSKPDTRTLTPTTAQNPEPRLLAPELSDEGRPLSADKRRKWCDDPENVEGLELDTDHVYTFHLWQHVGAIGFDIGDVLWASARGAQRGSGV
jgi:hypothetical protein